MSNQLPVDPICRYVSDVTDYFYDRAIRTVDQKFGEGYAIKNPTTITTILRFQEEVMRSVCTCVASGHLDVSALNLENLKT